MIDNSNFLWKRDKRALGFLLGAQQWQEVHPTERKMRRILCGEILILIEGCCRPEKLLGTKDPNGGP